jgi:hypothetical protein
MKVLNKVVVLLSVSMSCALYLPVANAAAPTSSIPTETSNGSMAGLLDLAVPAIDISENQAYLGYSIYQQPLIMKGKPEAVTSNPSIDFVTKHAVQSGFCSPTIDIEKAAFSCQASQNNQQNAVPGQVPYEKLLPLGDINFGAILSPNMYTPDMESLAKNLIRNILSPLPSTTYANYLGNVQDFMSDPKKKKDYATFMSNQAILSVASNSFVNMYTMRISGASAAVPSSNSNPASAAVQTQSIMSIMQTESTRRYQQPDFMAYLNSITSAQNQTAKETNAILAEMAAMQAFQIYQEYQRYLQTERIESLIAASLAYSINVAIGQQTMMKSASASHK